MIDKNSFDGGLIYGPRTFTRLTGRDKVWGVPGPLFALTRRGRACPYCCSKSDAERLWDAKGWGYYLCACGMIYTKYAPDPESLDLLYKQGGAQQEWVRLQQNETELAFDRLKFGWALEKAGWPFGHRRILDIGCSTGTLLEVAGGMAGTCCGMGVEINEEARRVAMTRLPDSSVWTFYDSLDRDCLQNDLVVLWEVLEHVRDPQAMLKRAWELVAPGGQLLLCVPNADSLAVRMLHEKASCFGLGHLQFYGPETLRAAINKTCGEVKIEFETIISWRNELLNWLNLKEPMAEDPLPIWGDWFLPSASEIHERLMGYKLVAWVRKSL